MNHQQPPYGGGGGGGGYPGQAYRQQHPPPNPYPSYGQPPPPQQYGSHYPPSGYNVRALMADGGGTFVDIDLGPSSAFGVRRSSSRRSSSVPTPSPSEPLWRPRPSRWPGASPVHPRRLRTWRAPRLQLPVFLLHRKEEGASDRNQLFQPKGSTARVHQRCEEHVDLSEPELWLCP